MVILGESGNFGEYVVSCKSSESGNLNVFGDYDECGNFCECCYFGNSDFGNSDKFYDFVESCNFC